MGGATAEKVAMVVEGIYGLVLQVNAEVVDHGLNLRLGGDAGSYVFRPDGV